MSRIKTHVKKGDEVEIITGNHKGKRGTVLVVDAAKGRVGDQTFRGRVG